jgi:hypothetical protein
MFEQAWIKLTRLNVTKDEIVLKFK